jgi:hypothetical protein
MHAARLVQHIAEALAFHADAEQAQVYLQDGAG